MAVLNESTTHCFAADGALLRRRQVGGRGRSVALADLLGDRGHGREEGVAASARESGAREPEFVRRRTVVAAWASGGVGLVQGVDDVVESPEAGMAGALGVSFGSSFQRADACF